jgi:hypothetical protein
VYRELEQKILKVRKGQAVRESKFRHLTEIDRSRISVGSKVASGMLIFREPMYSRTRDSSRKQLLYHVLGTLSLVLIDRESQHLVCYFTKEDLIHSRLTVIRDNPFLKNIPIPSDLVVDSNLRRPSGASRTPKWDMDYPHSATSILDLFSGDDQKGEGEGSPTSLTEDNDALIQRTTNELLFGNTSFTEPHVRQNTVDSLFTEMTDMPSESLSEFGFGNWNTDKDDILQTNEMNSFNGLSMKLTDDTTLAQNSLLTNINASLTEDKANILTYEGDLLLNQVNKELIPLSLFPQDFIPLIDLNATSYEQMIPSEQDISIMDELLKSTGQTTDMSPTPSLNPMSTPIHDTMNMGMSGMNTNASLESGEVGLNGLSGTTDIYNLLGEMIQDDPSDIQKEIISLLHS